jgi:excisionase family DNA binding protein
MNIHEVAKYTGFSTATIYKFTKNKEIPFEKNISKRLQFSKKEIDAWFATGNHKPYTKE